MGTNGAVQYGLMTIQSLGMVGDALPAEFPPEEERPARQRRGER